MEEASCIIDPMNQSGNILFLILIAVALFAALSYAVTQSTRSGTGSSNKEQMAINIAQLTQYPVGVRTAVVRMVIGGIDPTDLEFNAPSVFDDLTSTKVGVFHPDGGGATYILPPDALVQGTSPVSNQWFFNADFEVLNLGTSVSGDLAGNEYIALLPGISDSACDRINSDLGIGPDVETSFLAISRITKNMDNNYVLPSSEYVIGGDSFSLSLAGQPFGCIKLAGLFNYYYHVLLEQ